MLVVYASLRLIHTHTHMQDCISGSYTKFIQVAMSNKTTLLVDDLSKFPMCAKNEDVVNFNFCYYVGAPWSVGNFRGKSCVKQL